MRVDSWHFWFGTITGVVLLTGLALPAAVAIAWWIARRRRSGGAAAGPAWRTAVADVGLVYGTVPWIWLTMLPSSAEGAVSLVPLRDLPTWSATQVVGNLLVLAAVGLFAPMRFAALASLPRVVAVAFLGSASIETAQYVFDLGRVSSVDDVLLNTVGAALAALVSRPWWARSGGSPAQRVAPS